jgi:hypothetical protein
MTRIAALPGGRSSLRTAGVKFCVSSAPGEIPGAADAPPRAVGVAALPRRRVTIACPKSNRLWLLAAGG